MSLSLLTTQSVKLLIGTFVVGMGILSLSNLKDSDVYVRDPIRETYKPQYLQDLISKEKVETTQEPKAADDDPFAITLVTMYLNLGRFQKGGGRTYFTKETYENWLSPWANVQNKVVAFFENPDMAKRFSDLRAHLPAKRTAVQIISRGQLKAFDQVPQIEKIFAQPNYPWHPPNTVNANYSATMSAKYDAVELALDQGLVTSAHVAWIDLGYLRMFTNKNYPHFNESLVFEVPKNFDESTIAYSRIDGDKVLRESVFNMIKKNKVFVAGGFFLATPDVIRKFIKDYRETVREMIVKNMASTDQQFIAALYSKQLDVKPSVPLKVCGCRRGENWFCLGLKCLDAAWDRKGNNSNPLSHMPR